MITVANLRRGGLCNRLLLYIHCLSYAIEYDQDLKIINDEDLKNAFTLKQILPGNKNIRYKPCHPLLWKLGGKINNILISLNSGKEQDATRLKEKIRCRKNTLIRTYYFRNFDLVDKHQEKIREHYQFLPEIEKYALNIRDSVSMEGKKIVAVHMRKGDYRDWRGGIYFYTDEEFCNRMRSLTEKNPGELIFHIISNEKVNLEYFTNQLPKCARISTSSGNQFEDLAVLSKANYIMGPQSTYSAMAAFLGNKPLYFFERDVEEVNLSAFSWEKIFKNLFNGIKVN